MSMMSESLSLSPAPRKRCNACGESKPLKHFYRRSDKSADGRRAKCKLCYEAIPSRHTAARQQHREMSAARAGKAYRRRALVNPASNPTATGNTHTGQPRDTKRRESRCA